jgi:hypothetical protein
VSLKLSKEEWELAEGIQGLPTRDELNREIAKLKATIALLIEKAEPFVNVSGTWTVQNAIKTGKLLTLSNGERMCGLVPEAFRGLSEAVAKAREGA